MHYNAIPPQPSFQRLSPQIKAHNLIEISTSLKSWQDPFKAAFINNYGASGSNASIVVRNTPVYEQAICATPGNPKYPFWLSASDDRSLHAYAKKLRLFVGSRSPDAKWHAIQALSFNSFRQSNWRLGKALFLGCSTIEELEEDLSKDWKSSDRPPTPPVILCFGGQISTFVGLDRTIVENTTVFAHYLDESDKASTSLGFGSIYPEIFQRTPIQDIVELQLCHFSLQYAAAKSWLDCGVHASALVGYSFGELTALRVSNSLSLHNAIKMVAGRARIVRDEWGAEKGAMMAVEADLDQVEAIVQASISDRHPITIACFNGPRSFTLAGTSQSIDAAAQRISRDSAYSSISAKKLNVTNAFHSTLVEHLIPQLERMARYLTFGKQSIPVEFATKEKCREELRPRYIADHMRNTVYFDYAVQRLSERYQSSVWLEAGSSSTVTSMASRALIGAKANSHVFCPVNITTDSATTNLTSTTLNLWKAGVNATFWQHHSSQTSEYPAMLLPPYQFEKSKHWMELKVPSNPQEATAPPVRQNGFWRFDRYQDAEHHSARFQVLTESEQYKEMVSSHLIAQTAPICPATLEVEIAIEALMSQIQALEARGITTANIAKLEVIETDPTKPMLGLENVIYDSIVARVTHIVHNAWPMSGKRPLKGFEAQFKFMRNLLGITNAASEQGSNVVFQFISSIAVVGHSPTVTGEPLVPETRIDTAAAVLPNGYGDSKWACERMLDETLHRYPKRVRAMTVRLDIGITWST